MGPSLPQVLLQIGPALPADLGAASQLFAMAHSLAYSKQWSPVLTVDISDEIFLLVSWVWGKVTFPYPFHAYDRSCDLLGPVRGEREPYASSNRGGIYPVPIHALLWLS